MTAYTNIGHVNNNAVNISRNIITVEAENLYTTYLEANINLHYKTKTPSLLSAPIPLMSNKYSLFSII